MLYIEHNMPCTRYCYRIKNDNKIWPVVFMIFIMIIYNCYCYSVFANVLVQDQNDTSPFTSVVGRLA